MNEQHGKIMLFPFERDPIDRLWMQNLNWTSTDPGVHIPSCIDGYI